MEFMEGVYNEADENSEIGQIVPGESERMSVPQHASYAITENFAVDNETEEAVNDNPMASPVIKNKEVSEYK